MRIVAGELRRRKLLVNPGQTTRPITDRAKVMLFDHIRGFLPGKRVIDVFAGTGSLGFEALSRGARTVVFCEQDHRGHELLVQNAQHLGVTERTLCWRVDCLRSSFKPKGDIGWFPYDVIFFDPPYEMARTLNGASPLAKSLQRLSHDDVTNVGALLVVRTPTEIQITLPPCWLGFQVLTLGSMDIHLLRKESVDLSTLEEPGMTTEPQA